MRLLVVVAFGGVVFGLITIIQEGTAGGEDDEPPALADELEGLQSASEQLAQQLDLLRPSTDGTRARRLARRALAAQRRAVTALNDVQAADGEIDQERETEDALNADFDWLDGVHTVLRRPGSPLAADVGARGEAAIDAFEALDDDYDIAGTIRGAAALTEWARAQ